MIILDSANLRNPVGQRKTTIDSVRFIGCGQSATPLWYYIAALLYYFKASLIGILGWVPFFAVHFCILLEPLYTASQEKCKYWICSKKFTNTAIELPLLDITQIYLILITILIMVQVPIWNSNTDDKKAQEKPSFLQWRDSWTCRRRSCSLC